MQPLFISGLYPYTELIHLYNKVELFLLPSVNYKGSPYGHGCAMKVGLLSNHTRWHEGFELPAYTLWSCFDLRPDMMLIQATIQLSLW